MAIDGRGRTVEIGSWDNSEFKVSTTYNHTNNSSTLDSIVWKTVGIERARIHTNGNFGIGDTTPDYKLDIETTDGTNPFRVRDTTTVYKSFSIDYESSFKTNINFGSLGQIQYDGNGGRMTIANESTQTAASWIRFTMDGVEAMRIDGNRNIGIGTTPNYLLEVAGDIAFQ